MSIKIFNYTNDRNLQNIYGEDKRSEISAIIGNKGYAFMGTIKQDNGSTTYLVKKGSVIFSGGLCIRVLEDEKIDMTNNKYIVLETSYDPATKDCPCYGEVKDGIYNPSIESYSCIIKGVETALDETIQGGIKKHFVIYDKEKDKIATGLSADAIGKITSEELEKLSDELEETIDKIREENQNLYNKIKTYFYNGNQGFAKAALMKSEEEQIIYNSYPGLYGEILWSSSWTTNGYKWFLFYTSENRDFRLIRVYGNTGSWNTYPLNSQSPIRFGISEGNMIKVLSSQSTIYTFGGILPDNSYSNALLMFNGGTSTWVTKGTAPKALADSFIWAHTDLKRVYIIGGTDESGDASNAFMYYDETTSKFIELPQ